MFNFIQPLTNYLYGSLLFAKKNYTGAMYHVKQSLRVDPELIDGKALMLLRTVICHRRSNNRRIGDALIY